MISYLRFIEKDTEKFVLLETELEHVRNYAKIQEMRFPGVFEYQEDVPIELYGLEIPPLILQTFMENSVEHGLDRDKKNWIVSMQPIRKKAVCRGSDFISRTAESDSRRKTWKDFRKIHPVLT